MQVPERGHYFLVKEVVFCQLTVALNLLVQLFNPNTFKSITVRIINWMVLSAIWD